MTITEFLLARIAEDEHIATSTGDPKSWTVEPESYGQGWLTGLWKPVADSVNPECVSPQEADHVARWDPARVLSECAAKRAIVAAASSDLGGVSADLADMVLESLAQPYADHPDYRTEWSIQ